MITRRKFTGAMLGVSIAGFAVGGSNASGKSTRRSALGEKQDLAKSDDMRRRLAQIEAESGGRLGVSIFDTTSGLHAGLRGDERFPMCSTFKVLVAGAVLTRVDLGLEDLQRRTVFPASDIVPNSPATSQNTRERTGNAGMSIAELCKAAITLSDNTAANLLLATMNGPAGLTAFARSIGDGITRLDRSEPSLNEATPGDPRDTSTPKAMLGNLRELLLGERLSSASRAQLLAWLAANKTGGARIRARLPAAWAWAIKPAPANTAPPTISPSCSRPTAAPYSSRYISRRPTAMLRARTRRLRTSAN